MKNKKSALGILFIILMAGVVGVSASATELDNDNSLVPVDTRKPPGNARKHNHHEQAFAPGMAGWQQVNEDGFGDPDTVSVSALAVFNGYLYAGTGDPANGARIFRSQDGQTWTPVTDPGFGITHDIRPPYILDLTVFKGRLYASTGRGDGPGQIWRAVDGVNWAPMVIHGFNNPDTVDITPLTEFNNYFYAGAMNLISGAQVWRSLSGDNNTWTKVFPAGQQAAGGGVTGTAVFNEALYAAVDSEWTAQIWRSSGGDWTAAMSNGFGDPLSTSLGGMAEFTGYLYVGAGHDKHGAHLWRSNNGTSWDQVIDPGFGDPNNQKVEMVFVFQNLLYVSVKNSHTGIELWRSADGMVWEQANPDGFGDVDNTGSNGSNAVAEFQGDLYVGTSNLVQGGELWRLQGQPPSPPPTPPSPPPPTYRHLYLPVTLRQP